MGTTTLDAEQLAVDWLVWLRDIRGRSQLTITRYNQVLRFWLDYCQSHGVDPLAPGLEDLEGHLKSPGVRGRKPSPANQAAIASTLRAWYNWMYTRRKLDENYAEDFFGPSVPRTEGRPIPDEDWHIMWEADLPPRLRATLGLGFFCGLRAHELMTLESRQIGDRNLIHFPRKGGGKDTLPWLDMARVHATKLPVLLPELDLFRITVNHVRRKYDKLTPWTADTMLRARMRKLCDELRIPRYTTHQLRHSTATNLLRADLPPHLVMRLMNHSSFDITMRYVKAGATDLRDWLSKFDDPAEPSFEILEQIPRSEGG